MSEHAEQPNDREHAAMPTPKAQEKPKTIKAQRIIDGDCESDSAELADNGSYYRVWRKLKPKVMDAQASEDI